VAARPLNERSRTKRASAAAQSAAGGSRRQKLWRDLALIGIAPLLLYLLASLLTFSPEDPGWSHSGSVTAPLHNFGGIVGAWTADVLLYLCGYVAFLLPVMLGLIAWIALFGMDSDGDGDADLGPALRLVGIVGFLVSATGFLQLRVGGAADFSAGSGGILGQLVGRSLFHAFGPVGANLFLVALLLISTTLATGLSWLTVMDKLGEWVLRLGPCSAVAASRPPNGNRHAPSAKSAKRRARSKPNCAPSARRSRSSRRRRRSSKRAIAPSANNRSRCSMSATAPGIPPLALLDDPKPQPKGYSEETLETLLAPDRIQAQGFPHRRAGGRRLSGPGDHALRARARTGRQGQPDFLARQGHRARPVGEVGARGRRHPRQVGGRPGNAQHHARDDLPLRAAALEGIRQVRQPADAALGKDIAGRPTVADLARMPHLLVAGTTGSGKSVAVNAMVLSLLYKASAKDVRMLMIDPKMLELSVYQGIPHLLAPVVTDMKEAANGLRWCVAEMERRYKLMSAVGVRNLAGFNKKVKDAIDAGQPMMDPLFKPNPELGEAPRHWRPCPSSSCSSTNSPT
jgi:S-DNA-T family DNA segregation ATPase FtsK/SpoIIIE